MSKFRKALTLRRALVIASLFTVACLAATANASFPGLHYISASTTSDSVGGKAISLSCNPSEVATGFGGQVGLFSSKLGLTSVILGPQDVKVTAVELGTGTTQAWGVTGYAFCANPSALPGLSSASITSPSNSTTKSVTVTCPSNKTLIAVAGEILIAPSQRGRVALDIIRPTPIPNPSIVSPTPTSAVVGAVEVAGGTTSNWALSASAKCTTPSGTVLQGKLSAFNSSPSKQAVVYCPPNRKVIGVGGQIYVPSNQRGVALLQSMIPVAGSKGVRVIATATAPSSITWGVTAYAVCAPH